MPRTRHGNGAAASGSRKGAAASAGEMLQKAAAAAASSGGARTMDPREGPSGSDSSREVLQKKAAAAASSGGAPTMGPWEGSCGSDSDSTGGMLQKKAAAAASSGGAPTMDPGDGSSGSDSDSTGGMLQNKASAAAPSGEAPTMDPGKGPSGSDSSGEMLQKKAAAAASSGGAPTMDPQKGLPGSDSRGMLQKKAAAAASSGGSAALGALHGNSTAQDREESDAKHRTKKPRTISSAKIPHEHCTEDEGNMGLSGGMLQKQSPMVEADAGLSGDTLDEHLAEEADTAKDIKESDSNEIVHVKEEDTRVQEAKDLIKEMNASFIGEQISSDEFLGYYNRLPRSPPWIDLDDKLEDTAMDKQEVLHALYRFRYLKYQFRQQTSEEKLCDDKLKRLLDKSEGDCNQKFLEEEGFFRRFEEDMTLDWFIHPDYEDCPSLTDYQRLVLQNYGGTEYSRWSEYHEYLHSYETEKEYVKYCEELSKKLKWMEDYVGTYCPSLKWDYITSRGAYQAIKIAATDFDKITPTLAYNGYYECKASMAYDATWFKEYDGLYFEIWWRVTQKSISFEVALEEVYKLNMFPLRQHIMKGALVCDFTLKRMETEYQSCTKAIASGDTEEKARKLIAEAVQTRVNKPKSYVQYIRKKIKIARNIGILPREEDSEE